MGAVPFCVGGSLGVNDRRSVGEVRALLASLADDALRRCCDDLAADSRAGVRQAVQAARARLARHEAESARLTALYAIESSLSASYDGGAVVGVDEVGRGAVAGPLTAGACILPSTPMILGLNDSKQLTPARREELYEVIDSTAVRWSVGHATPAEIDALGVTVALRLAMTRALDSLGVRPACVALDGLPLGIASNEHAVVKGDATVACIAAASIMAKVTRDRMMVESAAAHPEYGFDLNKGYGTTEHLEAVSRHGASPLHRTSFLGSVLAPRLFEV
jgi:ribonuclease HII